MLTSKITSASNSEGGPTLGGSRLNIQFFVVVDPFQF
jgi:hypothetical protein